MKKTQKKLIILTLLTLTTLLVYFLRIQLLMAFSITEFSLLSQKSLMKPGSCSPKIAFHRGYSLDGLYPENTVSSLEAAVNNKVQNVEIDVSINGSNVVVGHDLSDQSFLWSDLLENFRQKFKLILIDVKEVKNYNAESVKQLLLATKDFEKVIFIGRKCDLMNDLSNQGAEVSCEAMGVIAHQLMGWSWWSVNYENIGPRYQQLLSLFPKKVIAWTLPTTASVQTICETSPEIVLIEKP